MTAWWAASSISAASTTQTSETRTLKSASKKAVFCGHIRDFVWWAFGLCARLPSLRRFLRGCLRRQKSRSRRRARGMVGEFREGRAATREGLSWSHRCNQRYLGAELCASTVSWLIAGGKATTLTAIAGIDAQYSRQHDDEAMERIAIVRVGSSVSAHRSRLLGTFWGGCLRRQKSRSRRGFMRRWRMWSEKR